MNSFVIFSFYTITRTVPSRECQKYELSKCNGCPIEYHFFCHKDFKTVFVFVLAQLEILPQNFGESVPKPPNRPFGQISFIFKIAGLEPECNLSNQTTILLGTGSV